MKLELNLTVTDSIYGISEINHKRRISLGLTNDEYVLISFLHYCEIHNKIKSWKYLRDKTGFDKKEFKNIIETLSIFVQQVLATF